MRKTDRTLKARLNGALIYTLLVGVSILLGVLVAVIPDPSGPFVPAALALVLLGLFALPYLARWTSDLYEPVSFVLLPYVGYPLGALHIVFLADGWVKGLDLSRELSSVYLSTALTYAIAGLLAFYCGYYGLAHMKSPPSQRGRRKEALLPAYVVIALFSLLGFLAWAIAMRQAGGLLRFVTYWNQRQLIAVGMIPRWGTMFCPVASLLWYRCFLDGRRTRLFWLHFLATSFILGSLGSREQLLTYWLILIVMRGLTEGLPRLSWRRLAVIGFIMLAFAVTQFAYRQATKLPLFDASTIRAQMSDFFQLDVLLDQTVGGRDLADIHILSKIVADVPAELEFQHGRTLLGFLARFIPGHFWPEKPQMTIGQVIVCAFYTCSGGGIPPGFLGELYLNFHVWGAVIGMFVFGLGCRFLYLYFESRRHSGWGVALYSLIVVRFVFTLTKGDLTLAAWNTFVYLAPFIVGLVMIEILSLRLSPA